MHFTGGNFVHALLRHYLHNWNHYTVHCELLQSREQLSAAHTTINYSALDLHNAHRRVPSTANVLKTPHGNWRDNLCELNTTCHISIKRLLHGILCSLCRWKRHIRGPLLHGPHPVRLEDFPGEVWPDFWHHCCWLWARSTYLLLSCYAISEPR